MQQYAAVRLSFAKSTIFFLFSHAKIPPYTNFHRLINFCSGILLIPPTIPDSANFDQFFRLKSLITHEVKGPLQTILIYIWGIVWGTFVCKNFKLNPVLRGAGTCWLLTLRSEFSVNFDGNTSHYYFSISMCRSF